MAMIVTTSNNSINVNPSRETILNASVLQATVFDIECVFFMRNKVTKFCPNALLIQGNHIDLILQSNLLQF